ncbi:MAG: hypothetical protein ABR508_11065 [Candidatus Baltobacteraceae bacterium]
MAALTVVQRLVVRIVPAAMFCAIVLPLWAHAAAAAAALAVGTVSAGPPVDGSLQHPAWQHAQPVSLAWDLQGHKAAPDATSAYVVTDGTYLYVAFDAKQRSAIVATQHTNDAGQGTDDEVDVDLWPGGTNGFFYQFSANPIGTHYQSSSENSGYRPSWWSAGTVRAGEYVVTMKIPLSAIHGAASHQWLVQFSRRVEATGDIDVWSYDVNETDPTTSVYAGAMTGIRAVAVRPKPRLELYNLGSIAGASAGGSTSRTGLDFSVPYTATSSFYGTIHPDYSNVELDQQSISPTAFRRYYREVRPFFTQGNAAYNNFSCDLCNGITTLYTPAIPTPRRGFAVEGKQGQVTYGAFDATGDDRTDGAQALSWHNSSHTVSASIQRVGMYQPGFSDDALELGTTYSDHKHVFGYFDYGSDRGTNVQSGRRAQLYDFGAGWQTPQTIAAVTVRKVGQYFNPADGFVWHPDIAGWGSFFAHTDLFKPGAPLRSLTYSLFFDRYHDRTGQLDQGDQSIALDLLTRGLLDVNVQSGSSYVRLTPDEPFYPVTQNGVFLTFGSGAENSSINNGAQHGSSATPTTIGYSTGRFGPGRLNSLTFTSTMRAARRGLLSFEVDGNTQMLDAGGAYHQWLERAAYTYQANSDESLAFGVRRIIGTPPMIDRVPPFQSGWNLSAAYHRTFNGTDEIYAVYGDASAFSTVPEFIMKWIHYFGAGRGT